jgi:hypothetical protein
LLVACKPKEVVTPACVDGCDGGDRVSCDAGLVGRCRGPKGCTLQECDLSRGEVGDPCPREGTFTCGDQSVLRCDGHKLVLASHCRGGCVFAEQTEQVRCDDSTAREGDTCDTPGQIACGDRVELRCQSGKFARSRECRTTCVVDGGIYCD